jgi:microcompartment protein CcmK/EutM
MNPPKEVLVPSASVMAAGPTKAPARAKDSIGVGSGENVLVSCIIIAIANFFANSLSRR